MPSTAQMKLRWAATRVVVAAFAVAASQSFVSADDISPSLRRSFAGITSKQKTTSSWRTRLQEFGRQDLINDAVQTLQTSDMRMRSAMLGALVLWGGLWLAKVVTGYLETLARLGVFGRFAGAPSVVAWGAGAGAFHTLSGPDHLAALAPLALRTSGPGKAFRTGVFWGFGHVLGQVLLGNLA
ncbi:unnamed protein product [Durusdinium trenchii]|uniref:Uncharacterized protein n=1 Tax=Durusdinium trenchii TaxID=1381693 RepID=A0ABP0JRU2_9DINO